MDCCRKVPISGGHATSEYYKMEQPAVLSPACSKLGSLDDLFSGHFTQEVQEADVSLEWLSIFVEDCLSSSGNCLLPPVVPRSTTTDNKKTPPSSVTQMGQQKVQLQAQQQEKSPLQKKLVIIPGKARSKRRRRGSRDPISNSKQQRLMMSWSQHYIPNDPPLLHQAFWLADSELILPTKEDTAAAGSSSKKSNREEVEEEEEEQQQQQQHQQQGRRCRHCQAQKTPQWRAGPWGPKTLCNACGVRYKLGRLLPEYRPAKSPTFVSYKHSNSHKKVLEMRTLALLQSSNS